MNQFIDEEARMWCLNQVEDIHSLNRYSISSPSLALRRIGVKTTDNCNCVGQKRQSCVYCSYLSQSDTRRTKARYARHKDQKKSYVCQRFFVFCLACSSPVYPGWQTISHQQMIGRVGEGMTAWTCGFCQSMSSPSYQAHSATCFYFTMLRSQDTNSHH